MVESPASILSAISGLFPDDALHKHPETGVSLLDDVRDVMEPLPLRCIFCPFQGTLDELKKHSACCPEHPAVKELAGLRGVA